MDTHSSPQEHNRGSRDVRAQQSNENHHGNVPEPSTKPEHVSNARSSHRGDSSFVTRPEHSSINERRTSILQRADDELPRHLSIDDAITSLARKLAGLSESYHRGNLKASAASTESQQSNTKNMEDCNPFGDAEEPTEKELGIKNDPEAAYSAEHVPADDSFFSNLASQTEINEQPQDLHEHEYDTSSVDPLQKVQEPQESDPWEALKEGDDFFSSLADSKGPAPHEDAFFEQQLAQDDAIEPKESIPWPTFEEEPVAPPNEEDKEEAAQEVAQEVADDKHNVSQETPSEEPQAESTNKLDELFAGADDDFLDELQGDAQADAPQVTDSNLTDQQTAVEEPKEEKDNFAFLEMDDDLLLDDDFLSDEDTNAQVTGNIPTSQPQVPKTVNRYAQAQPVPPTGKQHSTAQDFTRQLAEAKKKHDAYDFPSNFLPQTLKPAPRTHNKYGPSSSAAAPPTTGVGSAPPRTQSTSSTQHAPVAEQGSQETHQPRSVPQALKPQKSFFEELPIPTPKVTTRPARSGASKPSPVVTNPVPVQQNTKPVQPPINPYAALNLKATPAGPSPVTGVPNVNMPNGPVGPVPPMAPVGPSMAPAPYTESMMPVAQTPTSGPPLAVPSNTNSAPRRLSNAAASPYVPKVGPYGPSGHVRHHSRASSLVGGKGKEVNPYAPALSPVTVASGKALPQSQASSVVPPPSHLAPQVTRSRKVSNPRSIYGNAVAQQMKPVDPNIQFQKQFPIFNWGVNYNVSMIPKSLLKNITISLLSGPFAETLKSFPGPLSKKLKPKEVEKWLRAKSSYASDPNLPAGEISVNDEIGLILSALLAANGDANSADFLTAACSILNPHHYSLLDSVATPQGASHSATAYKLDNSGLNQMLTFCQAGHMDRALELCIAAGDWALALIIGHSMGPQAFGKIASDYARTSYPFQKSQSKLHHLMPIILKVFAGNVKSVLDDFLNVATELEWVLAHWRDVITLIAANAIHSPNVHEFLTEFGKLLAVHGNTIGRDICFVLTGASLSPAFNVVGGDSQFGIFHTEIYEYALSLNSSNGFTPAPNLLVKLNHAQLLADYGLNVESQRYCDHIGTSLKGARQQQISPAIVREFQRLLVRVSDTGANDQAWYGGMSKLNKVWGQLDKFITGDEDKDNSKEKGVFSKFSPSVSRNASTTDITSMDHRPDYLSVSTSGSVPTSQGNHNPRVLGTPAMPTIASLLNGPSQSGSIPSIPRYAPGATLRRQQSSPQQPSHGNEIGSQVGGLRYAPSNASLLNLANPEDSSQLRKPLSKYSRAPQTGLPYNNIAAQGSTLSIGLYVPQGTPSAPPIQQGHNKQPSLNSIISNDYSVIRDHNRSPLVQSDISLDYPVDFREGVTSQKDEHPKNLSNLDHVPPPAQHRENEPAMSNTPQNPGIPSNDNRAPDNQTHQAPPPSTFLGPPPPLTPPGKPPARKSNPYAPGARPSKTRGKSRYGPPVISDEQPQAQPMPPPADISLSPSNKVVEPAQDVGISHQPLHAKKPSVANVDDSFTSSYNDDSQPALLLMLNHEENAYAAENQPPSKFGLGDEFPIPGSPEVTTRANLVYGGQGGFFLSRLSQSHQSTMYQQYEVTDDTVQDYVPLVEEEEDEDEAPKPTAQPPQKAKENTPQKGQNGLFSIFGIGKNDGKPKPIRAKMGEPMKLVYDEELKAWIDPSIPRDQQLKKAAPPPPPKMKAAPKNPTQPAAALPPKSSPNAPGPTAPMSMAKPLASDPGGIKAVNGPRPSAPRGGPQPKLANANLDDLLSLGSQSTAGGRKGKRGARRGYVNVMEQ